MGLDLDAARHFAVSLSLPCLHQLLTSLFSPWLHYLPLQYGSSLQDRKKMTAASTYNLHTPLYFQPKTRLSFLQHQFQGQVPIGSPMVTWSLTEPITVAWGIEFNDQPDLSHMPISLARSVIRRKEMQNPARFFFFFPVATLLKHAYLYPQSPRTSSHDSKGMDIWWELSKLEDFL